MPNTSVLAKVRIDRGSGQKDQLCLIPPGESCSSRLKKQLGTKRYPSLVSFMALLFASLSVTCDVANIFSLKKQYVTTYYMLYTKYYDF